jgi:proteasome alpha subunit
VSMPFYVSPEQAMKDKADYARKGIARGRNSVVVAYDDGILFVAPNPSSALHKVSEIYDRIAFAAVGRYNEYENLRVAGVRFADTRGYQYARDDVTARGLANWYAQILGSIFTESNKPYEVEIVVAEVGETPDGDQMYRITFDGSVADEHDFVAMGGQAEQVAGVLKERYAPGLPVEGALGAAIAALSSQGNGDRSEINASQLEVAVLVRGHTARTHRTFRRITGARLEELLAKATRTPAGGKGKSAAGENTGDGDAAAGDAAPPPGDGTGP